MKNLALIIKICTKIEDKKHLFLANLSKLLKLLRVRIECFWSVDSSNTIKHFRIFRMVFFSKLFNKRLVLIWDKHVLCETRCLLNNYHSVCLCHFYAKTEKNLWNRYVMRAENSEISQLDKERISLSPWQGKNFPITVTRKEFPFHRETFFSKIDLR